MQWVFGMTSLSTPMDVSGALKGKVSTFTYISHCYGDDGTDDGRTERGGLIQFLLLVILTISSNFEDFSYFPCVSSCLII